MTTAAAHAPIRQKFVDLLAEEIPFKTRADIDAMVSPELISEFRIQLPSKVLKQAQAATQAFFAWREHPETRSALAAEAETRGLKDPGNYGICMSYDYHLDSSGDLKLIEINTNAAFLGLSWILYQAHNLPWSVPAFSILDLRRAIEEELRLANPSNATGPWVILDENPQEQRLKVEFDYFLALFRKWGLETRIADLSEVTDKDRFIYNRYTDFFLEEEKSQALRKLYLEKKACFSPHPFEYLALADKARLRDFSQNPAIYRSRLPQTQSEVLDQVLLPSSELTNENAEEIWRQRKGLFFKPLRAFGGKQTYKGASVSRKAFDAMIGQGILAQQVCPAAEVKFETPVGPQDFKFDLRFYAYQGTVQGAIARLYQGQLTNTRTAYGGFAVVEFI